MTRVNLLSGLLLSGGRRIYLSRGRCTVVSDSDYAWVNAHKWSARKHGDTFYAQRMLPKAERGPGKPSAMILARVIVGLEYGDPREADHINRNTLDNRRENLRVVSKRGNMENRRDQSKYGPGVVKRGNRFSLRVCIDNQYYHVGMFSTPEEAAIARKEFL